MKLIGIETSCDETAVSVVEDGRSILSNVVATQSEMHSEFGGIVPEVASRQHLVTIIPVVNRALAESNLEINQIDGIGVTYGPGLAGSLLVGVNAAKGLAISHDLQLYGVNHLEGHIYASWLGEEDPESDPGFPIICLIASGGHTDLILMEGHGQFKLIGRTRDDAAGEAFDKGARVLGLGFPGGPEIQRIARSGSGEESSMPRPRIKGSLDFSFSGLKTALLRRVEERGWYSSSDRCVPDDLEVAHVASVYQEAIVDTMVSLTLEAMRSYKVKGVILGGGVAANSLLREEFNKQSPVKVIVPEPKLCTDNGAMIGSATWFHLRNEASYQWDMDVIPSLRLG